MLKKLMIIIFALFLLVPTINAEIVILNHTHVLADTDIGFFSPDENFGTNTLINIKKSVTNPTRGWLMFDISSIPSNSIILDAELGLFMKSAEDSLFINSYHFFSNSSWDELNITYNNNPCGNAFVINGSSCNSTSSSNQSIPNAPNVRYFWNITSSVRQELQKLNDNVTTILQYRGLSGSFGVDLRFATKEEATINQRPILNISFVVVIDETNPQFAAASINNSNPKINEVVALSQVVTDETALNSFRFSDNQTGTFINQSPVSISGTSFNATFNLTVNLSRSNIIAYQWWVDDSSGNVNISSIALFTVANTAPQQPTILFPTTDVRTNLKPMDINVTFPADADSDTIIISYYINDTLNQTSSTNTTFNASSGNYNLKVSIDDSFASSPNASVNFVLDIINPVLTRTAPENNSIHSASIPVSLSCTDANIFLLNYTFFQGSTIIKSVQNLTPTGTELSITDTIDTNALASGLYNMNITCSDTHTSTQIPSYSPEKDIANIKLTYNIPQNNDNIGIKLKSTTATLVNFNTMKEIDRYTFYFEFEEIENGTIYEYVFKITNQEKLTYLPESDYKAHFITNYNWIDFDLNDANAVYTIKKTQDDKYEIKIETTKTFLNFNSIGGLNIITQQLNLIVDNTAPVISVSAGNLIVAENDILQFNITCTDANGISLLKIANNVSGILTNITTINALNITPFIFLENHTVVLGSITHQFTCLDAVNNVIQSEQILYNSTEAPVVIEEINLKNYPYTTLATTVIVIIILFFVVVTVAKNFKTVIFKKK